MPQDSSGRYASKRVTTLILLMCILALSGCMGDETQLGECYEGDDFGNEKVSFPAYITLEDESKCPSGLLMNDGTCAHDGVSQTMRWKDTGYVVNVDEGDRVIVSITGKWSPYSFGMKNAKPCRFLNEQELNIGSRKLSCPFLDIDNPVNYITGAKVPGSHPNAVGFPCYFQNGFGLYLGFKRESDQDPNANEFLAKNPTMPNIHVWSATVKALGKEVAWNEEPKLEIVLPETIFTSDGQEVRIKSGMKIFGKVLDTFYEDNIGSYKISFKSGVVKPKVEGMFQTLYDFIVGKILIGGDIAGQDSYVGSMFTSVTQNANYRILARILLVLFICLTGLSYAMGLVEVGRADVMDRIFKIGFVLLFLQPNAWNFMYSNLFGMYLKGTESLLNIAASSYYEYTAGKSTVVSRVDKETGRETKFSYQRPFEFLDRAFSEINNMPNLMRRMSALIGFSDITKGSLYFLVMVLIILFYDFLVIKSFALFVLAIFTMGMLFILSPFVALFYLLGDQFKTVPEGWFKLAIIYSMQYFIRGIFIIFLGDLIVGELQKSLGFKICYTNQSKWAIFGYEWTSKGWVPGDVDKWQPSVSSLLPFRWRSARYGFNLIPEMMLVPPLYKRKDCRYQAMPFLAPDDRFYREGADLPSCPNGPDSYPSTPGAEFAHKLRGYRDNRRLFEAMFDFSLSGDNISDNRALIRLSDAFLMILLVCILWSVDSYIDRIGQFIGAGQFTLAPSLGEATRGMGQTVGATVGAIMNLGPDSGKFAQIRQIAMQATSDPLGTVRGIVGQKLDAAVDLPFSKIKPLDKISQTISTITGDTSSISARQEARNIKSQDKSDTPLNFVQDVAGSTVDSLLKTKSASDLIGDIAKEGIGGDFAEDESKSKRNSFTNLETYKDLLQAQINEEERLKAESERRERILKAQQSKPKGGSGNNTNRGGTGNNTGNWLNQPGGPPGANDNNGGGNAAGP